MFLKNASFFCYRSAILSYFMEEYTKNDITRYFSMVVLIQDRKNLESSGGNNLLEDKSISGQEKLKCKMPKLVDILSFLVIPLSVILKRSAQRCSFLFFLIGRIHMQ